jgi:4,5-DOPA dioxygenase extradiol
VRELITGAGLPCAETPARGLDHGAWIPLKAMYPAADIPVVQLAIQPFAGPDWHRRLGAALRPLRDEGVLILASGAVTHNFDWLTWGRNGQPVPQAAAFADWLGEALARDDRPALIDYRRAAPTAPAPTPPRSTCCRCLPPWVPPSPARSPCASPRIHLQRPRHGRLPVAGRQPPPLHLRARTQ